MARALAALLSVFLLVVPGMAQAATGNTVQAPGIQAPPEMDWVGLSETAAVRPTNELDGEPNHVMARLILDKTRVKPGETVRLGVHLEHDPEWHTYWRAPGEVQAHLY